MRSWSTTSRHWTAVVSYPFSNKNHVPTAHAQMVLYFQTLDSSFLCFFSPFLFLSHLKCRLNPPPPSFLLLYLVIMYVITVGFAVNNLIMIIIVSYPFSNTVRADFLLRMRDSKFSPVHTSDLEQLLYSPKLEFSGFKVFVSVQREL